MQATFEDLQRLEEVVRRAAIDHVSRKADHRDYARLLPVFTEDAPQRGPSVRDQMAEIGLPPTLHELLEVLKAPGGSSQTDRITRGLKAVRERLIERSTGDPGRHVKRGTRSPDIAL